MCPEPTNCRVSPAQLCKESPTQQRRRRGDHAGLAKHEDGTAAEQGGAQLVLQVAESSVPHRATYHFLFCLHPTPNPHLSRHSVPARTTHHPGKTLQGPPLSSYRRMSARSTVAHLEAGAGTVLQYSTANHRMSVSEVDLWARPSPDRAHFPIRFFI